MRIARTSRRALAAVLFAALAAAAAPARQQPAFDKSEFAARRAKLFEKIGDGVAVIYGETAPAAPVKFRQAPDFFYLTGIEEPDAVLMLDGKSKQAFVFVAKRTPNEVRLTGPGVWQLEKPEDVYGVKFLEPEMFFPFLAFMGQHAQKLYVPVTPPDGLQHGRMEAFFNYEHRAKQPLFQGAPENVRLIAELKQRAPQLAVADVSPLIDALRWVKTPYEIERVRRASAIGAEGVKEAIKGTRPGLYEYELEAVASYVYTKRGARGRAFMPIVASGPNTVVLHYEDNTRQMKDGEVVYMDYGADYDYYTSDITRTWPVSGRFTPAQEKMYRCVLEARDAIIAMMRPGVTVNDMKDAAQAVYKKHGFEKEFLESGRYVGHPVGISVHDPDQPGRPFEAGVIFNVEPVVDDQAAKVHMRLEDTVLITPSGAENLTAGVPAGLEEIYGLIKMKPLGGSSQ